LESQTAWRKVYVPPNCSYEHFLTLASDEFGSPVVVYEYKDLSGDIIDHDPDKPVVGWGRLLKFLQKQTEAGNYAELKVWVRPGRRKSVESPAPLLKRGSAAYVIIHTHLNPFVSSGLYFRPPGTKFIFELFPKV
jgi:hypothetical protein